MKAIEYIKARLCERSTYMLFLASVGSIAGLARPFNWISCAVLVLSALTPDGPLK